MTRTASIVLLVALCLYHPSNKPAESVSADPLRTIAILENERMIAAEPDITLAGYFQSGSEQVRVRALLAAGRIGNPALLRAMHPLVQDKSAEVRKHLAFAIGQIKSKNGLSVATALLKDRDLEVRRLAVEAIGRIGNMEATAMLTPFLRDPAPALREQAALGLALIKDRGTVNALVDLTRENDPVQWSYVYALYRVADERSVPALHAVLANPVASPSTGDPSSLLFALKALWAMKKPLTAEEAERLLSHQDPRVQQNALDVIAASGAKDRCAEVHKHYLKMDLLTKTKALEAMGNLDCVLEEPPADPGLFGAWIVALAKTQKEEALPFLQQSSKQENWIVRWRAAQALGELQAAVSIPRLTELIQDPDSAVRLAALDSLAKYLPDTAVLFSALLEHEDFAVRATAADALGKTKNPVHLHALRKAYDASQSPDEIEGRVALLDALAEFQTSEVLPLYERALLDPSYTIRRHAVDAIKKLVGSKFYTEGQLRDPEEFLYRSGKMAGSRFEEYPNDFGTPQEPWTISMKLEKGDVIIRMLPGHAPLHVENFRELMSRNFYDGLRIHRVVPNFVIQGGDSRGDGWGGAGEVLNDQFNLLPFKRGMMGMPTAGKDTGGSQFFITHSRQPHLDGNYTIFGEVLSGMEVIDRTEIGDRILSVVYHH